MKLFRPTNYYNIEFYIFFVFVFILLIITFNHNNYLIINYSLHKLLLLDRIIQNTSKNKIKIKMDENLIVICSLTLCFSLCLFS